MKAIRVALRGVEDDCMEATIVSFICSTVSFGFGPRWMLLPEEIPRPNLGEYCGLTIHNGATVDEHSLAKLIWTHSGGCGTAWDDREK
jgi:hypothetical protein